MRSTSQHTRILAIYELAKNKGTVPEGEEGG